MKGDIIMTVTTRSQYQSQLEYQSNVIAQPTVAKHTRKKPKIPDNSNLQDLAVELKNVIFNSADPFTSVNLSKTSKECNNLFKKIWENKEENPNLIRILTQKYERKYPYLHLIAKPSLQEAIGHYNQQIINYIFLTEFKFEDELSNTDLWKKINKVLEAFDYKVDKKIDFYTFCLSFDKLAENAAEALINLASNSDNQQAIVEAGAIDPLVTLLDGTDTQKRYAARALIKLARNNQITKKSFEEIERLVTLVMKGSDRQKEFAARAIRNLNR